MTEGLTWKPDVTDYHQCYVSRMSHLGFLQREPLRPALWCLQCYRQMQEMMSITNFDMSTTAVIRTNRGTLLFIYFFLIKSPH